MERSLTRRHPRAFALLITLAFIVLITLIIVGFAVSMRLERPAANLNLEKTRARLLTQIATDEAAARLLQATSDPARNWISQPGQIVAGAAVSGGGASDQRKILQEVIPLASGTSTNASPGLWGPVNLNIASLRDPTSHLITEQKANGSALPLAVPWIYVRRDGGCEPATSGPPDLADTNNPIVGRYAYWVDDESSKVNYNLAWGRSAANTNAPGHPSQISLRALPGMDAAKAGAIHAFITADPGYAVLRQGFFNTPDDVRRVEVEPGGTGISEVIRTNRFDLTHYSDDPNTTFFGEPRIVLTTRPDRAGWKYQSGQWVGKNGLGGAAGRPYYLRILANEGTTEQPAAIPAAGSAQDPGLYANLDAAKLNDTLSLLLGYLQRTDWPVVDGPGSLQSKYYSVPPYPSEELSRERLAQLALNIIDYVRSVESPQPVPDVMRAYRTDIGGTFRLGQQSAQNNLSFMGLVRGPRITEMGLFVKPPVAGKHQDAVFKVELYLPPNYGLAQVDVTTFYLVTESTLTPIADAKINAAEVSPSPILRAGEYVTVSRQRQVTGAPAARPVQISLRAALSNTLSARRIDVTPLSALLSDRAPYTVDGPGVAEDEIASLETDDPRVNKQRGDWQPVARNSFGRPNSVSTLGQPPTGVEPQQDTDADGKITDASLFFPPPAGQTLGASDNRRGMVLSAGELGRISTGIESATTLAGQAIPAGVPWRTLRLQPSRQPKSVVPDWALIDCFTAPLIVNTNAAYVYEPRGTSIGGRVNVNALAQPFGLQRLSPLTAVLLDAPRNGVDPAETVNASAASLLAGNIASHTLASGGKSYGYADAYDSVGEIVEIAGIADTGEAGEELFRQVSNLITTRGNVFTIHAVGQALVQTPSGGIEIRGEERSRAIVERYLDATANTVRLGTVFYQSLTP